VTQNEPPLTPAKAGVQGRRRSFHVLDSRLRGNERRRVSASLRHAAFRERGLDIPRTTVFASSIPARTALVASGRFITTVPGFVLRFPGVGPVLKRLPIELPTTPRPFGIVTLKNRTLSPVAQLFIDCARELAKPLAKGR
jgi:DNA-binding transcriptional LysR family regulator